MIREILKRAYETVDSSALLDLTEAIWRSDYSFTFPAFESTAKLVDDHFRKWGLERKIIEVTADGKHVPPNTDWRMPMAWDCQKARLEILSPDEAAGVWLDRDEVNCCVVQYSGGTPEHGLSAEIVYLDTENGSPTFDELSESQVSGKLVLLTRDARGPLKRRLHELGCLGVILAVNNSGKCEDLDATFWINGWSDLPGAWAFTHGDSPLPGMVMSKAQGRKLKALLDKGKVRARMTIDARYYEGHILLPMGFYPGEKNEEILLFGHLGEQGANDNASGSAVVVETMHAVKKMSDGKLKRGVRAFLTNECYGTIGYIESEPSLKRTIAALNWDCVGVEPKSQKMRFPVHANPMSSAGYTDTLIQRLFEASTNYAPYFSWYMTGYAMADTFLMDPALNIPLIYGGGIDKNWHTTTDTMDVIDADVMRMITAISVAYVYFLANAGTDEAIWLAEETAVIQREKLARRAAFYAERLRFGGEKTNAQFEGMTPEVMLGTMLDGLEIAGESAENAIGSVLKLDAGEEVRTAIKPLLDSLSRQVKDDAERLKAIAGCKLRRRDYVGRQFAERHVPIKKFIGPPTFDSVNDRGRRMQLIREYGAVRWDRTLQLALFWTDGKRTLDEIIRRTLAEVQTAVKPDSIGKKIRGLREADLMSFECLNSVHD